MATKVRIPKKTGKRKHSQFLAKQKPGKLKSGGVSTAKRIRDLREGFGVNQALLVRLSGYSPRSIASWAKGTKATRPAAMKFTELGRLFDALSKLTQNPEEITAWFQEPNEAFDGSTPLQVIERGESDRLWRMIYSLRSGEPS